MCFRVECKKCGKFSWGGCGNHLTTLFANIEKGKHCMCKSWPGIAIPVDNKASESQQKPETAGVSNSVSVSNTVNASSCPPQLTAAQ